MGKTVLGAWLLTAMALPLMAVGSNPSYSELAANFTTPPKSARAGVYWYFMDGNLSRAGATKDLEAMREAGIGYVIFLEVGIGVPRGKVDFMSEEWLEFFRHIVRECERLDIQMVLGTGPGWCGSGGPWVQGGDSMRHLVSSSTTVEGGTKRTLKLPMPSPYRPFFGEGAFTPALKQTWRDYYEDVAVLAFPTPSKDERIADAAEKAHFVRAPYSSQPGVKQYLPAPTAVANPRVGIDRAKMVDLTNKLKPNGTLEWEVPAGNWTILRLGARNNGAVTRPAPLPGVGFECDKFDAQSLQRHFANFTDKIYRQVKPRTDCFGGLKYLHIDSWEMGAQNWSGAFRTEFTRRRGYDPLPFYPAWEGRIVGDENLTERFLWDLRRTSQELIVENHVLAAKRYAHDRGLLLSIEPYDMNPAADLELGVAADIPMGEFWRLGFNTSYAVIEGVSAAHVIGQSVVPAESFTSHNDAWQATPGNMKDQNDWALAVGLNRFFFHTFQHQCLPDSLKPGMTMGPYGVHWDRNQTWWPMASGYHTYLSRCQYLLQQGRSVADILYLAPESTPHVFRPPASALEITHNAYLPDRRAYNFDGCPPSIFLQAKVKESLTSEGSAGRVALCRDRKSGFDATSGKVVLPCGAEYEIVVLPEWTTATPRLLEKYRELLLAGATLVGNPPKHSPSLQNYPACDEQVKALVRELWGEANEPVRRIGKGTLYRQQGTADQLYENYVATTAKLAAMGVTPDFTSDTGAVRYHHRTVSAAELYFVASRVERSQSATCRFRQRGKHVEVWNALDGKRYAAQATDNGKFTEIKLDFAPLQSYFVVFTETMRGDGAVAPSEAPQQLRGDGALAVAPGKLKSVKNLDGSWVIDFHPPVGPGMRAEFAQLADWSEHVNSDIRYFSGIATYEKRFDVPEEVLGGSRFVATESSGGARSVATESSGGARSVATENGMKSVSTGGKRTWLSLGKVHNMARVRLNGKDLGIQWTDPWRVETTGVLRAKDNVLEIEVANLWSNRLIGDAQLPPDGPRNGQWPEWVLNGRPRPTQRVAFQSWNHYNAKSPLRPSGLLGPVEILIGDN